jgi:antitoxin component of MazEF toxin-antitoxin module
MQKLEIQKWGNSAAIRLNKGILKQVSCEIGSTFEAIVQDDGIFLKPIAAPHYSLDELLETCTKDNIVMDNEDREWLQSTPVGKET